jgi:NAD(P)-dependent dehydrogenase (short-subunit alcohol dehydrogenase family)
MEGLFMNKFNNQVAVITGAGGTLCSEIAIYLAEQGAKTVLIGRNADKLQDVANKILSFGGTCMIKSCDVTDEEGIKAIADEVLAVYGPCRYLINGAGGNNNNAITTNTKFNQKELDREKPKDMVGFFDLDMNTFESVIKINTLGTVIPSRIFAKQMAQQGQGNILNFASMNSYRPLTRVPAYAMSKAAVVNFTQWLATYLAPAGIRVNAIAPGFFVNERSKKILYQSNGELSQRGLNIMSHTPMERFGDAKELLGTVSWLLDDEKASFVTGITVSVDGGFLAHSGI